MYKLFKPGNRTRKTRAVMLSALVVAAGGAVIALPVPASAASDPTYEVDVLNHSSSDVKVRFFYGPGEHEGDVTSEDMGEEFANAKKLPTSNSVALDSGAKSSNYAYQVSGGSYDNGFWLEVSRGDDQNDRTVAKFYRWNPGDPPPSLTQQDGSTLKIENHSEPQRGSFAGTKTRIVITDPRSKADTPFGDSDSPFPRKMEMNTNVGVSGSGWQNLDGGGQQWKQQNLRPNTDYWFRCSATSIKELAFNGHFPKTEEVGEGVTNGKAKGFWVTSDKHGAISVLRPSSATSEGGACDIHSAPNVISAKRITGSSTNFDVHERPIYRVDIQAKKRTFDSASLDSMRIPPYTVEGKDGSGAWRKIGTVLPTSSTGKSGSDVTHGGGDFLFQNKSGETITHLRVAGGFGTESNEVRLGDLPQPSVSMNALSDMDVVPTSTSSTGRIRLEANGAAQEELTLELFDQDGDEIPATGPLSDAYDSIYFRDENGKLITGMYEPGGASATSRHRGPAANSGSGTPVEGQQKKSAFLSTTDTNGGLTWVTPNLDLDDHMDSADIKAGFIAPQHSLSGNMTNGVLIAQNRTTQVPAASIWENSAPVYRVRAAGDESVAMPNSVAVFRYKAMAPAEELPRENIQKDGALSVPLTAQAGALKVPAGTDMKPVESLTSMTVSGVTKYGTLAGPFRAAK
ncbi:hypothetical protein [Streptomyces cyaneofuscatus]|uniref:hypothetical protein n=1 Tax=Streptomyces cyaneofuscatus TaxID=66883 RepID=UPI0038265BF2